MTTKEDIAALRAEQAQLRADLATLIAAVAPHVTQTAIRELAARYALNGTETRPSALPERRMKVVA